MGFIVKMGMDNGSAVNDMAMGKKADIHIVKCEYHKQNGSDQPFIFPRHSLIFDLQK
jgi:hypothetical protein